jgi:hypothetical protein
MAPAKSSSCLGLCTGLCTKTATMVQAVTFSGAQIRDGTDGTSNTSRKSMPFQYPSMGRHAVVVRNLTILQATRTEILTASVGDNEPGDVSF